MTLEKVFPSEKKGNPASIFKFLKQHNPFKTMDQLFNKAGLTKEESLGFIERPDSISFRSLSKLMAICDLDLKLTLVMADEVDEAEEMSDIYLNEDNQWEEEVDWEEEESEEDVYWV